MEAILEQHGIKPEQAIRNTRNKYEPLEQVRQGVTKEVRRYDSDPDLGDTTV